MEESLFGASSRVTPAVYAKWTRITLEQGITIDVAVDPVDEISMAMGMGRQRQCTTTVTPDPATEALLRSLYFVKRMQMPSSMVVAAASALHANVHNRWAFRSIGIPYQVSCDQLVKECDECIFSCQTMFDAPVAQVLARAPPEVKRHAKHVFMLLKYRMLPRQLDMCWLMMAHIFMDGDADKARACVVKKYPNHFFSK